MLFSSDFIWKGKKILSPLLECRLLEKNLSGAKVHTVNASVQLQLLVSINFTDLAALQNTSYLLKLYFASVGLSFIITSLWMVRFSSGFSVRTRWIMPRVALMQRVSLSLKLFRLSQSFMPLNQHKTIFRQRLMVVFPRIYAGLLLHFILHKLAPNVIR